MKRYEPSVPRFALGVAAIAMAAVTMAAMVFAPAGLDVMNADSAALSLARLPSLIGMLAGIVPADAASAVRSSAGQSVGAALPD